MANPKPHYKCIVPFCTSTYFLHPVVPNKHFFSIPVAEQKRKEWFDAINSKCCPKVPYSHLKMYVCVDHFADACFTSTLKTRLNRFAIPTKFPDLATRTPTPTEISNVSIISNNNVIQFPASSSTPMLPSSSTTNVNANNKRKAETPLPYNKKRMLISKGLNVKQLTLKKEKLYFVTRHQQSQICKLRKLFHQSRSKLKAAQTLNGSNLFKDIESNFDPAGVVLIKSQFQNAARVHPIWTRYMKIVALSLYKQGPRFYRNLKRYVRLPSVLTIQTLLKDIPLETGINPCLMQKLKSRISKFKPEEKFCCLLFDEISLSTGLTYCRLTDKLIGYEDLGSLGRTNQLANHSLVFMVQGVYQTWKQPVAYYFTKDTIKTSSLKKLICEIIGQLQLIGLKVLSTVCDQGSSNRSALKQLKDDTTKSESFKGPYFIVNGERIMILFDVPHLLKSTRNGLCNYIIEYPNNKKAKWLHLIQAYYRDAKRRFRALANVQERYLYINKYNYLKMKVAVAARTLSRTMAGAIETMVNDGRSMSSEAIHTAEFIDDINNLFDTFNGHSQYASIGNIYRRAISLKSQHIRFWSDMLPKIENWVFINEEKGIRKTVMPFKIGWLNNIRAMEMIWEFCKDSGFEYLRTRAFNQDSLENLLSSIRAVGAAHSNPSCYQFIGALKTNILNNLMVGKHVNTNCEDDGCSILDNLREFVENNEEIVPLIKDKDNELLLLDIPPFRKEDLFKDSYSCQPLGYVRGFFIKRINTNCNVCQKSLNSDKPLPEHIFTYLKKYDKERLKYVSIDFIAYIAHVYDLQNFYLEEAGSVLHLMQKLNMAIRHHADFSWFQCMEHAAEVQQKILNCAMRCIMRKYCTAVQDRFLQVNRQTPLKKREKLIHVSSTK